MRPIFLGSKNVMLKVKLSNPGKSDENESDEKVIRIKTA
jgi:hypothetical protein